MNTTTAKPKQIAAPLTDRERVFALFLRAHTRTFTYREIRLKLGEMRELETICRNLVSDGLISPSQSSTGISRFRLGRAHPDEMARIAFTGTLNDTPRSYWAQKKIIKAQ